MMFSMEKKIYEYFSKYRRKKGYSLMKRNQFATN